MTQKKKTVKSIIWDHKNDCYFCKRPISKFFCRNDLEFEMFISPYVVCEYCRSNTFRYIATHFTDDIRLGVYNRKPWDYMKETHIKLAFLYKIHLALKHTIKIAYNTDNSLDEYYYKKQPEKKDKIKIEIDL